LNLSGWSKPREAVTIVAVLVLLVGMLARGSIALSGSPWLGIAYLAFALPLSGVNIPLYHLGKNNLVCVNAGGCVMPLLLSLAVTGCLALRMDMPVFLLLFSLTMLPSMCAGYLSTTFIKEVGIVSYHGLILPLCVFAIVWMATSMVGDWGTSLATVRMMLSFVIGTFGTFVGSDLLRQPQIEKSDLQNKAISIGGAGVVDGVFINGIFSALFFLL